MINYLHVLSIIYESKKFIIDYYLKYSIISKIGEKSKFYRHNLLLCEIIDYLED